MNICCALKKKYIYYIHADHLTHCIVGLQWDCPDTDVSELEELLSKVLKDFLMMKLPSSICSLHAAFDSETFSLPQRSSLFQSLSCTYKCNRKLYLSRPRSQSCLSLSLTLTPTLTLTLTPHTPTHSYTHIHPSTHPPLHPPIHSPTPTYTVPNPFTHDLACATQAKKGVREKAIPWRPRPSLLWGSFIHPATRSSPTTHPPGCQEAMLPPSLHLSQGLRDPLNRKIENKS